MAESEGGGKEVIGGLLVGTVIILYVGIVHGLSLLIHGEDVR